MWKYICPLLIALGIASCQSSQKTITNNVVTESYTLPDSLSVSPAFRIFWEAWNNDLQQAGVALTDYTPSEELAQRYILRQSHGSYCLSGFLHTYPDFNIETLTELGGHAVAYNGGIYTFSIPLKELPRFVTLPGIKNIESASTVQMRRP